MDFIKLVGNLWIIGKFISYKALVFNMIPKTWLIFSLIIVVLLLVVVSVIFKKKKRVTPDYYAFYIMGVTWLVVGIPLENLGLMTLGILFAVIGIMNKDKWRKNKQTWSKLKVKEKSSRLKIMAILIALVVAGVTLFVLVRQGII
jgi:hypothetical protein